MPVDPKPRTLSPARVAARTPWLGLALAGFALLAGCQGNGGPRPGLFADGPLALVAPQTRLAVAGGDLTVAGPPGFCIDRAASQDSGGLVVLSACRGLGAGLFGPRAAHPAVLTAAVSPSGRSVDVTAAAPELKQFFASARGRQALSRSGAAQAVEVSDSFVEDGVYYLHLIDRAPFRWGQVQADYWRAVLPLGGRMVSASVLARAETPLTRAAGLALLQEFIAAMRKATVAAGGLPG